MKKLLLILTVLITFSVNVSAYDFIVDGLCYNINIDGISVTLTYETETFSRYTNLYGDLVIPASVTYNNNTYSVTAIGPYAFYNCIDLTSVIIPCSVTEIHNYAFSGCTNLISITIPNLVTRIGIEAFSGCTSLTSITIPNMVTNIGNNAFTNCTNLSSIIVENENLEYDSRGDCNAIIETASNKLIVGCKNTIIPNSVTEIGPNAFYNCSCLTSVSIPESITKIGSSAFEGCTGLTSVNIPNAVTEIGKSAFSGCTGLTNITIPNTMIWIGESAFSGCTGLTSVNIPDSLMIINDGAFFGCSGLTSIEIPESVTKLGDSSFANCTGITSVIIPNSVKNIGTAFYGCSSLDSIYSMIIEPQNITYEYGSSVFGYEKGHVGREHKVSIFKNVNKECCKIYVPTGTSDIYKSTCPWYDFSNIIEYDYSDINKEQKEIAVSQDLDSLKHQLQQLLSDNMLSQNVKKLKSIKIIDLMIQDPQFLVEPANYGLITKFANEYYLSSENMDYNKAILCYEAAINLKKNTQIYGSKDIQELIRTHRYLADCYHKIKKYDKVKYYYKEAFELYKSSEDNNIALDLFDIGKFFLENKECDDADKCLDEAIKREKALFGENNEYVNSLYQRIGDLYFKYECFEKARNNYEEVIKLFEDLKENIHNDLENLSVNSFLYEQTHEKLKKAEFEINFNIAEMLVNVGACYYNDRQYEKARKTYEDASKIYKDSIRETGAEYYSLQLRIGKCYYQDGLYDEAFNCMKSSLNRINEGYRMGYEMIDYAADYVLIGKCYYDINKSDSAMVYYRKALSICKNELSEYDNTFLDLNKYLYKHLCKYMSLCELSLDDIKSLYILFRQTLDHEQTSIIDVFNNFRNETTRAEYWQNQSELFQYNYPAVAMEAYKHNGNKGFNQENIRGDIYNKSALFAKGLLLTSENEWRRIILNSGNSNLIAKYHQLLKMNNKDDANELEQELFEFALEREDYMKKFKLTWDSVQAKLAPNDIAIEFLSFPIIGSNKTQYIALTVRKGDNYKQPHLVVLCEENDLKKAMDYAYTSKSMSKLIWKKLADAGELKDVDNIYFSPSGLLHTIAIESMPHWSKKGVMMSDKFNIYRLTSTRELALNHCFAVDNAKSAVVYGGIIYDVPFADMETPNQEYDDIMNNEETFGSVILPSVDHISQDIKQSNLMSARAYSIVPDSTGTRGVYFWKYLDWSKDEVDTISNLLKEKMFNVHIKTEKAATESSFKDLFKPNKSNSIIHIATHGFYWNDSIAMRQKLENNIGFLPEDDVNMSSGDKSMRCCGLLFAGAQNTFSGQKIPSEFDGVLTAQEVANLNLRGTNLVVLSACQTALGEINGDGVFGLQRGFKKAGAQSIIMSLWSVSDKATQDMMTEFYKAYNPDINNKREAFLIAQKFVKEHDSDYTYSNDEDEDQELRKTHPHWAAFILLDAIDK